MACRTPAAASSRSVASPARSGGATPTISTLASVAATRRAIATDRSPATPGAPRTPTTITPVSLAQARRGRLRLERGPQVSERRCNGVRRRWASGTRRRRRSIGRSRAWGSVSAGFEGDGAVGEGGGEEYLELIGSRLWIAGKVDLGRFRRLSDYMNIVDGYMVLRDVVVLSRRGEPSRLTLPELRVLPDDVAVVGQLGDGQGPGIGR